MAFSSLFVLIALAAFLTGSNAALTKRVKCTDGHTVNNAACCKWFPILQDIQENLFHNGECGDEARESLRLAFHDAIGFSPSKGGGGADGSIITFAKVEMSFGANAGVQDIVDAQKPFIAKWNVTPGDFVQFASAVGVSNCPGAPRTSFLAGRPPPRAASPDLLIPAPFARLDDILARFADAGFDTNEVVALLASHSVAKSAQIDPTIRKQALDTTPKIFDSQIFVETQLRGTTWPGRGGNRGEVESPITRLLRLQSDHSFARDSRTACEWQSFVLDQDKMRRNFAAAMLKLSITGHSKRDLVDCSDVIPAAKPHKKKAFFPAGLSNADIEQACADTPFPKLPTKSK